MFVHKQQTVYMDPNTSVSWNHDVYLKLYYRITAFHEIIPIQSMFDPYRLYNNGIRYTIKFKRSFCIRIKYRKYFIRIQKYIRAGSGFNLIWHFCQECRLGSVFVLMYCWCNAVWAWLRPAPSPVCYCYNDTTLWYNDGITLCIFEKVFILNLKFVVRN